MSITPITMNTTPTPQEKVIKGKKTHRKRYNKPFTLYTDSQIQPNLELTEPSYVSVSH